MCRRILEKTKATLGMERVISYLPLSHIAAQLMDIYFPLSAAASCWFAQPDALKVSIFTFGNIVCIILYRDPYCRHYERSILQSFWEFHG